jgi:leucyl-tRNA---protein transferase
VRRQFLAYDGLQACPYLEGRVARLPLYRQLTRLDPDDTDAAFAAGERRVGRALYKTACPTCQECKPIRVLVDEFEPSRSQRRAVRKFESVGHVELGPPDVSTDRVMLYNRHKRSRKLAEPDDELMTEEGYHGWLVDSCMNTVEMRYLIDRRLVGVGILDVGRTAASSVYFYFDPEPEVARLSPGVFSVLAELAFCRSQGLRHLYLGLYVRDCAHLSYKADYRPHERYVDGDWRKFGPDRDPADVPR